ncbi:uncharacterized protein LOC132280826 [Cornus florida]|uniref:uncharacterized protein LOC132280826 n=1 Tax=Cornus florida TaxID=4283 RepID=UPI00289A18F4|nr:uncharacterized protein LOC132280826 [Cornus florida]
MMLRSGVHLGKGSQHLMRLDGGGHQDQSHDGSSHHQPNSGNQLYGDDSHHHEHGMNQSHHDSDRQLHHHHNQTHLGDDHLRGKHSEHASHHESVSRRAPEDGKRVAALEQHV